MPRFLSAGIDIAYEVYGEGRPILLIHGFASSGIINWVNTGWVEALQKTGWAPITIDNRGHGGSRKLYDPKLYFAHDMADDAARLLDLLGHAPVPVMGYSMGARISAYLALRHRSGSHAQYGAAWASTSSPGSRIPKKSSPP